MADNSARRFKFISPGVFVNEVDNSQLPALPGPVGPLIIGRTRRGPANVPVVIDSFSDFVETFGNPVPGNAATDVWRQGDTTAPTYAAYAAQAWLRNNSPITFLRPLGDESSAADATGKAGWEAGNVVDNSVVKGGAYGLVVWPSSSANTLVDGVMAAQFYCPTSRVILSGSVVGLNNSSSAQGSTLFEFPDINSIKLRFTGSNYAKEATVSLNPGESNFIRKVLNTNPTITNSAITTAATRTYFQGGNYWLGETFERRCLATGSTSLGMMAVRSGGTAVSGVMAAIFPLTQFSGAAGTDTAYSQTGQQSKWRAAAKRASTGWVFAQDLSTNTGSYRAQDMQKLFRLEALTAGEDFQRTIKISISNIRAAEGDFTDFGTFSILVRKISDTDANPQIIERYDQLSLNPMSPNYVARIIGDKYEVYDETEKRLVQYGEFDNVSNYIRVVMDEDVAKGTGERRWLPFGVFGPLKYKDVSYFSLGGADLNADGVESYNWSNNLIVPASGTTNVVSMVAGGNAAILGVGGQTRTGKGIANLLNANRFENLRATIQFPGIPLRMKSTQGTPRSLRATYWGVWTGRTFTDTFYDLGIPDYLRARQPGLDVNPYSTNHQINDGFKSAAVAYNPATASFNADPIALPWVFSLDNVSGTIANSKLKGTVSYTPKSRRNGNSLTAKSGQSYVSVLKLGIDRFTTVLAGGTDGYDITERDPFAARTITTSDTVDTSSTLYTLRKAIDIVSDPDYVQMNAVAMPGIVSPEVTNYLLETAQERGDTLAIIDIEKAYTPDTESSASAEARNEGNTPEAAVTALTSRAINNSYGATYYPWVRITDTIANQSLWAPPSIAALGVLSTTDRAQAPWFAPAGFTRGGLSEGAGGIPVVDVSRRLTSDDRDLLYENNINPIAKFPAEGIVIYGQKTLQQTASALDRINVRRLMIYLKREISFIASRLIFAPNTQLTWDRFLGQANPLLESVKAEFGVEDFTLILDDTTTTPDLIDRNIIYAKLMVKPTRAAEFFAIDFVVTNSGASFED
ncbi:MAG TPA: hypothetical protein DEQ32_16535 [Gammaproteobacteria bacterium]|nr:hypothetical protein [Gammaproteobacteria bacterium]